MRILAFTGLRFSPSAGEPQVLAAPPFDQINPDLRDLLQARSPYQFAHLTRALPGPENNAHKHARVLHDQWCEDGKVKQDDAPSLYPYVIEIPGRGQLFGICSLVGIGKSNQGDLRPHELTVDKPLADRLALLEAGRVDLEPVMYIAEDDGTLETMVQADCQGTDPVAVHEDGSKNIHRLYQISDPQRIAEYQKLLGDSSAVIADGHHRTKVSQLFAEKHSPEEGSAGCAKMAVLFSLASQQLVIDPIHRAVQTSVDREALESMTRSRKPFEGKSGAELAAAVAAETQPALGVQFKGGAAEIWQIDPAKTPEGTPGNGTDLSAVLLHHQVLAAAGMGIETSTDGSIQYKSDPDDLWDAVAAGDCTVAIWLPPMDPAVFAKATETGDVLPPKSTRFLPKLISGLVWSGHNGRTA